MTTRDTTVTTPLNDRVGYAIVGYPAAGKSEAGRILADLTDGVMIETGDIVRRGAEEHFAQPSDTLTSKQLGDYSTMRRETDGGDYVAQDALSRLDNNPDFPTSPAIITGLRDTEAPQCFDEHLDTFRIIWIHADFDERLQRLQQRGRQDEGDFTKADLAERDGRESMWGTSDLSFMADIHIRNEGTMDDLRRQISETIE